jgi:flagellar biosynthetic protein FliR
MTEILQIFNQFQFVGQDLAWRVLLVFMRVGAAMSLLPAFGEQAVPQRIKLVITLAFTLVVAPASGEMPQSETGHFSAMAAEVVIGLALGISLRLMVLGLQTAGSIAANATSLSQLFGGAGPEPQPALSNLLVMSGLALALAAGLHVHLSVALIKSYQAFPAGELPNSSDMANWGVGHVSAAFSLAFVLAAPFTIAAFLYNVALGVINRAMPALMVSFIGAPALAGGGLLMIAVVVPVMLAIWVQKLMGVLSDPFAVIP